MMMSEIATKTIVCSLATIDVAYYTSELVRPGYQLGI